MMDFNYDPYEGLAEFCSSSFDDKIRKEAAKLKDESENLNESDIVAKVLPLKESKVKKGRVNEKNKTLISQKEQPKAGKEKVANVPITKQKIKSSKQKSTERDDKIEEDSEKRNTKAKTRKKRGSQISTNTNSDETDSNITIPDFPINTNPSQLGRARRSYMARLAANLPTQDVIDLASPSNSNINVSDLCDTARGGQPRRKKSKRRRSRPENIIVIGSDSDEDSDYDEIKFEQKSSTINKINILDDEDNPEIQILVEWHNNIEKLQIRKYQKFYDIINIFAKKENVPVQEIFLNLENNVITEKDTVESINYKFGDIITGRVIKNCQLIMSGILNNSPPKKDKNKICLKIQSEFWKKPVDMYVKKCDNFKILYIQCAETFKLDVHDFMLKFDGNHLDPSDTLESIGMEEHEIIDCVIKKKY